MINLKLCTRQCGIIQAVSLSIELVYSPLQRPLKLCDVHRVVGSTAFQSSSLPVYAPNACRGSIL